MRLSACALPKSFSTRKTRNTRANNTRICLSLETITFLFHSCNSILVLFLDVEFNCCTKYRVQYLRIILITSCNTVYMF